MKFYRLAKQMATAGRQESLAFLASRNSEKNLTYPMTKKKKSPVPLDGGLASSNSVPALTPTFAAPPSDLIVTQAIGTDIVCDIANECAGILKEYSRGQR